MACGDGKSINIWDDPWVGENYIFPFQGKKDARLTRVSHLMKEGHWDVQEVTRIVGAVDASLVLAIPLSQNQIMDRLVWNHTKSGCYLTCSGYKTGMFWFSTPWKFDTLGGPWTTLKDWWNYITTQLTERDCEDVIAQLACLLWSLWKLRNAKVFRTSHHNIISSRHITGVELLGS
ncbi:hypothetical protein LIER_10992 [Lithospermum erythrorhizon]|uniref:Uncharacterized protein n=1 Tax=Lithospermum erythrorhizon TaxID=34254 RepID=A0AAV3PNQ3_LITER